MTIVPVCREIVVAAPQDRAFDVFARRMGSWWNPLHRILDEELADVRIEPRVGGRWAEVGHSGAEYSWGRVLVWEPPSRLVLAWQIGPTRVPEPDPDRASEVEVRFEPDGGDGTRVELVHRGFERHGDGAEAYRAAMDSEQGWDLILGRFAERASRG